MAKRLRDSIENCMGQTGDPWVFICTKKIKNPSRNGKAMAISPERLRDSIEKHMGQKGFLWCSFI